MSIFQIGSPSSQGFLQDHRKINKILKIRASSRKKSFFQKKPFWKIFFDGVDIYHKSAKIIINHDKYDNNYHPSK
jgi:hypothetical protein